ncbi:MAG: C-type lectin domain-containing protein [Planctomycetes bacterium]|nr:C-type lectin domain-containing protein [Planctomycetota bacterium]
MRSVAEAEKKVRDARAELGGAYESVVTSLTTAREIEAAKATRTEWMFLSTRWDEAAPRRVPLPAARHAARPRGIVTRPKNGAMHPDLDVAWRRYEAAVDNAIEEVQSAIRRRLDAATERGDLDAVEQWQKTHDEFRHVGAMPVEKELKASVNALRRVLREEKEKLSVEYAAVVKTLTTNKDLELAKAVRGEGRLFGRKEIPKDAFTIADHSYYFFTDPKTQAQAQEACEKLGGYLARVNSRSEQDAMNAKLESFRLPSDAVFWVDGSDKQQEGHWCFVDGSPLPGDLQWLRYEPNNADGGEHGLQLLRKRRYYDRWDVGLNDGLQDGKFGFLCEWDEIEE